MTRNPELSEAIMGDQLELYRRMWVLRLLDMALEESRIDGLLKEAIQPAFGQEAVAVGVAAALRPGDEIDTAIPHFRHARRIADALPLAPTMARLIGLRTASNEPTDGLALGDWKNSLAATTTLGQSTLFALGNAHQRSLAGDGDVTVCAIGHRDADSPEFTAAASIALAWRLPVVFVVENVRTASGARHDNYVRRADGMPARWVDGKDVVAVRDAVAGAVHRAGAGGGPTLVSAVTYRTDHPAGADPLVFARRRLTATGVDAGHLYEVERRARQLVAEAERVARATFRAEEPPSARDPLVGG
ncbi:thiamine pyrophosphate-dependent enzyme [Mycobacterium sp. Marseille-P9652]|uniref:thiamine pyrophosphate-dependent enzyme n=1 Tax=Mycobacterium sp. Marseille-P9652 TaxID=2654950 RepID=UPI0018CFFB97|nr:thiamine pyrophosphate-dependent enzyme [Mycobacterium sp. Marseille-P9652]